MQEGDWDVRGRYSKAIQDDDTPLAWDVSPDGKYTLSLRVVSVDFKILLCYIL
jgi:hypothetical protein